MLEERLAAGAPGGAELPERRDGVGSAGSADAAIAQKDLIAKVAWLGAKLPLVDAVLGAESESAAGNFQGAPSTEAATVGTTGSRIAVHPASGHGAYGAHGSFLPQVAVWKGRRFRVGNPVEQPGRAGRMQ